MSFTKTELISILSPSLPDEIVDNLIGEYMLIKQHLLLTRFSPSELNGGRFSECIIRLLQHLSNPPYTAFGKHLVNVDQIIRQVEGNLNLQESIRFYIPRLARVLLDVRNRRNVAHVGGEVDPNYSDSLLVSQIADWIIIELIRIFYRCSIDDARKIVLAVSQVHIPVVFSHNGFLKVQTSSLTAKEKVLILLYYKKPADVADEDLIKWTRYSNSTQFKNKILVQLDKEALVHYDNRKCVLTTKGVAYVEKHLKLEIIQ